MIQSKLMPVLIKVTFLRLRYKWQGLKLNQYYHVIGYDTKYLIITNDKAEKAFTVMWGDIELIKSEVTSAGIQPDVALLNEMQLLRKTMSKLRTAEKKKRVTVKT